MKLRNIVTRFTSLLLVMLLVFSFVACDSSSSDDSSDDKESSKGKEVTFDELINNATSGEAGVITTDMITDISEDNVITYDEVESLFKEIPSFKAEAELKVDFYALMAAEGETSVDESFVVDGVYVLEYDNEDIALHMGMSMDIMGEEMSLDFWLVNEDGTYYMYQQENDDVAYRREIGNIEEAFGEGIDLDELQAEMEADMEEFTELYEEMFATAEDLTESELVSALSDYMKITEKNNLYNIVMDFNANKIIDLALDSDELAALFDEAGVDLDELVEILDEEITDGIKIQDIVDLVDFDVTYSIDITDLFLTSLELDVADCVNDICDLFEDYILDMADEQDVSDVKMELDCKDAYIKYDFEKNAKVKVEFDGEYEDYDDYYDDYYNDNAISNVPMY